MELDDEKGELKIGLTRAHERIGCLERLLLDKGAFTLVELINWNRDPGGEEQKSLARKCQLTQQALTKSLIETMKVCNNDHTACPYCKTRDTFGIREDKYYFCSNCLESGNIITFLMKQKDLSLKEALLFLQTI